MTKKEKAILKLAQKWAKARCQYFIETPKHRGERLQTRVCGRALLKILEGRDL